MNETLGQKAVRIQREYFAMPEQEAANRIQHLCETLRLFSANAAELRAAIEFHGDPANLTKLWAIDKRQELHDFQREICRLLHNFLAAAMTLDEHTKVVYRLHYEPNELVPGYNQETDRRFKNDPLHNFVKGMRNYFLHAEFPVLTSRLVPETGATRLELQRDALERNRTWSRLGKQYMELHSWTIDLADACGDYLSNVEAFHRWFRRELERVHGDQLTALGRKREELIQAQRDAGFD